MTGSMIKKKTLLALAALFAACVLMMSCVRPAYANVDPTWEEEETVIPEQTPEETPPEETVPEAPETEPEQGFTTPGNGDLGDEIKNSTGKDFSSSMICFSSSFPRLISAAVTRSLEQ